MILQFILNNYMEGGDRGSVGALERKAQSIEALKH